MRSSWIAMNGGVPGYLALPTDSPAAPAVLVYMEAFGLNDYIQAECRRLAERGFAALAPDFFRGEILSYGDRPAVMAKLRTLTDERLLGDVRAAIAYLDDSPEVRHERYGAIGFCMGGRLAVLTAAEFPERIGAAVSLYGGGIAPENPRFFPPLADRIPEIRARLLLLYGADDESIPPAEHARMARLLSENKKAYAIGVYPDAGHGFASTDRESYRRDAAEDAWKQALAFFDTALS